MFVRKKTNKSGTTSVVVVDKSGGKYRLMRSFGSSSEPAEIERLCAEATKWVMSYGGQQLLDFDETEQAVREVKSVLSRVERTLQNTPQAILNRVYDAIGFNAIGDDILRHLVAARICQPMSKVATAEYLKSHFDEDVRLHNIYRYMDRLHDTRQEAVQRISVEAHICICFVAYKVYKELERLIRSIGLGVSIDRVLSIAKTITTLRIRLPNGDTLTQTLFTTPEQESIMPLLEALSIPTGD